MQRSSIAYFSFDIFDTLLTRAVLKPMDVFLIHWFYIRNKIKPVSKREWVIIRMDAETQARHEHPGNEPGIIQIYEVINRTLKLDQCTLSNILELELALEKKLLFPIQSSHLLVEKVRNGNPVFFISDMYLPDTFLKECLLECSAFKEADRLYVSNILGINKHGGLLFRHVANENNIHPSLITHYGDNEQADYISPRKLDMKAVKISECLLNRYEQVNVEGSDSLSISAILGSSKVARLAKVFKGKHESVIWNTGSNIVGPLFVGYVLWVMRKAKSKGIAKLYFVARDGQILYKIAEVIKRYFKEFQDLELQYIYGSRQAWHLPAIETVDEKVIDWIFDSTDVLTLGIILGRVNISYTEVEEIFQNAGIALNADKNLSNNERVRVKEWFKRDNSIQKLILQKAQSARKVALEYFNQVGMFDHNSWAIVDIGWYGRLQNSLRKLMPESIPVVTGFYFGLLSTENSSNNIKEGYCNYFDPHFGNRNVFIQGIIELFASADHGTCLGYKKTNNIVEPILKEKRNIRGIEWGISVLQESVLNYATVFCSSHELHYLDFDTWFNVTIINLQSFVNFPNNDEAITFGKFKLSEQQTEDHFIELAPLYGYKDYLKLAWHGRKKFHAEWDQAVIKRNFRTFLSLAYRFHNIKKVFLK